MKVKDLIKELLEMDQEFDVIMASDSEGNNFGPFSGFGTGMYVPDSSWSGMLYGEEDAEDWDEPYVENCVVFWPVN